MIRSFLRPLSFAAATTLLAGSVAAASPDASPATPSGGKIVLAQTQPDEPAAPTFDGVIERLGAVRDRLADRNADPNARIDDAVRELNQLIAALQNRRDFFAQSAPGNSPARDPWSDLFAMPGLSGDRWDPFLEMRRMQQMMDRQFADAFGRFRQSPDFGGLVQGNLFSPDMDLRDEDDNFVVRADIPGADKSDIKVEVDGNLLTISGERSETIQQQDAQGNFIRQERIAGSFHRAMTLPGPVKEDEVQARYENGVLTVTLPKAKADEKQPALIRVE